MRRWRVMRLGGVVLLGLLGMTLATMRHGPVAHADGGAPNLAYITGAGAQGDQIAVFDINTRQVTKQITVGGQPAGIVLSGDSRYAYVTETAANRLAIIDVRPQHITATIPTGPAPLGIAIELAPTPKLYVTNSGGNTVTVIAPDTQQVQRTITVGQHPQGVALAGATSGIATPGDPEIYVANAGDDTVSVISTATDRVIATVPVPGGPAWVVVPTTGGVAYVATKAGAIHLIGLADHRALGPLYQPATAQFGMMDYDAVTGQVYVPDATGATAILAPASASAGTAPHLPGEPARTLNFGGDPVAVAITFDGAYGFLAEHNAGQVVMFDASTRKQLATASVGGTPRAIITGAYPPLLDRQTANSAGFIISGLVLVVVLIVVIVIARKTRQVGANNV